MKKTFKLQDLDCANCAMKMENSIRKIEGVDSVSISYMSQRLTIEAADEIFDETVQKAQKAISKVEPDCRIIK